MPAPPAPAGAAQAGARAGGIAVPVINITKTRLNDPLMWFLGTNEQPGDYRSSGCTACHTLAAMPMTSEAAMAAPAAKASLLRRMSLPSR